MSSMLTLVSASGLWDTAIKSAAVLLLAMIVVALSARASAAWRHLVWCLSVVSLLLLPVLSLVLPVWRVDWLPPWSVKPTQVAATTQTDLAPVERSENVDNEAIVSPSSAAASQTQRDNESLNRPPATIETAIVPRFSMPWLALAWAAGGLLALLPLAIGLWQLGGLQHRSQVIGDRRWLTLLDESRRQLHVRRNVQLRHCESSLAPLTWGALRPVLLLPLEFGTWSDQRRRLVLLHELAHVRRWDWLTQLVANVACAAYWFNPFVWLAARQMRIERERACDDLVLRSGARASDYARELLALAMGLSDSQVTTLMAVPMARRVGLNDRLHGILDVRRSRAGLTRPAVCLCAALAVAATAPLAMLRAAPPESNESEPVAPEEKPPLARVVAPEPVERREEVVIHRAPEALGNQEAREIWDVTLEEAIQTALANSKVMRNLGGRLFTAVVPESNMNPAASRKSGILVRNSKIQTQGQDNQGSEGSPRDPLGATKVRFVLAQTNGDIALADFQAGVGNLVSDVERAYWDLYFNYRSLNAVQAGRDSALQTWRKVHALFMSGSEGGEAAKEAQAREQYFLFRAQVENTLGQLYTSESRLRFMMGVAAADGRLIRPTDDPITEESRFELKNVIREALNRRDELSNDQELDLVHVLTNSLRDSDRNYQVSRTTYNRRTAAAKQVEAVHAAYKEGAAALDMLLDAQRRLADAEIAYYRALVDYNVAILQVHFRKGSLLEYNGILVARGTGEETSPIDPFRQRARDVD